MSLNGRYVVLTLHQGFSLTYGEATWRLRRLINLVFACLAQKRTIMHDFGFVRSCHYLETRVHQFHELTTARECRGSSNRASRLSISHDLHIGIVQIAGFRGWCFF